MDWVILLRRRLLPSRKQASSRLIKDLQMPCYTAWNEYLEPGTPEYSAAEQRVRAKLKAVQHIVNYYYRAFDQRFPLVKIKEGTSASYKPASTREKRLLEMICHHFACDGIHFTTLYDACSVLDCGQGERRHKGIIMYCATLMRSEMGQYRVGAPDSAD